MEPFPIPVRAAPMFGAGSQPDDDAELDVMPLPRGMNTFEMPRVPQRVDPAALAAAHDLLAGFAGRVRQPGATLELAGVAAPVLDIVNQVLGEGEVSIRARIATGEVRVQETVFAGCWRCCALDVGGRIVRDWLEAGPIPAAVLDAARAGAVDTLGPHAPNDGAMNAPALLAEIAAALAGGARRQVNLSLLPLTPADRAMLEAALPVGPVAIMSRGFGNCRVSATTVCDVWRVQYFNSMNTLILDTLEVTPVPEVALASDDDLADSHERLAELLRWMQEAP
jgi:hydrogenase-1 operon protein HyaF